MAINFQPIYVLASGGERALEQIDNTTNNLANVNTSGFKKLIVRELSQKIPQNKGQKGDLLVFPRFKDTVVITTQGGLRKTDNPLDVAIQGKGYFQVETPNGVMLTRNGHFFFDKNGFLVDENGNYVLNNSGSRIALNTEQRIGTNIYINQKGQIFQDNQEIGTLGIVNYEKIKPVGYTYYKPDGNQIEAEYTILQGFLEDANVNPIEEMTNLITHQRRMDIYGNLIKGLDNIEQKTNEIGRA
ncbi:MAG: flagellar biosynthesis protein FlgF [Hydrogenothermus sp.]|nr:MAG: flagellar biosynthesis protein FlgF [Hydrogenothermus sp.]